MIATKNTTIFNLLIHNAMSNINRKKSGNFVMLDKTALNDSSLSWKAKGLHSYLMGLPDDWKVYLSDLKSRSKDGRDGTAAGINELIDAGYVSKERIVDDNMRFIQFDYTFHEHPIPLEQRTVKTVVAENGKAENGKAENGKAENGKAENGKADTNNILNEVSIDANENTKTIQTADSIFSIDSLNKQPILTHTSTLSQLEKDFEYFRVAAKKIGLEGAGGFQTEFDRFRNKNKDWKDIVPLLLPAIQRNADKLAQKKARNEFAPSLPNFSTWMNQKRWEQFAEEVEIKTITPKEYQQQLNQKIENSEITKEQAAQMYQDFLIENPIPKQYF